MGSRFEHRKAHPKGIWIVMIALLFPMLAWGMQFFSLLNWEMAIQLGIQNESFSGNLVERTLANVEWGIAMADIVWVLPLTILAFVGIFKLKLYGMITGMMVFAICVYFPLFFTFQRWNTHLETVILALFLFLLPSLIGMLVLWANRASFTN